MVYFRIYIKYSIESRKYEGTSIIMVSQRIQ